MLAYTSHTTHDALQSSCQAAVTSERRRPRTVTAQLLDDCAAHEACSRAGRNAALRLVGSQKQLLGEFVDWLGSLTLPAHVQRQQQQ